MPSFGEFANAAGEGAAGFMSPTMPGMMAPITEAATALASTLKKLMDPFQKVVDLASHFVEQIDPALLTDLNRKFRDLNATIGIAVRPIVDVAREIVKYLSDRLLPVMRQLQPFVEKISEAIGGALMDGIDTFSRTMDAMMPTFAKMTEIVVGLVGILQDVSQAFIAFGRFISDLVIGALGGMKGSVEGVKEFMADLRVKIQGVIEALILFVARLLIVLGATKAVEQMIKSFQRSNDPVKKDESGGLAIALNPMFKAIGDLSKSVMLEAFAASAGGEGKGDPAAQSAKFLEDISGKMQKILDDPKGDVVVRRIEEIKTQIMNSEKEIEGEIRQTIKDWYAWFDRNVILRAELAWNDLLTYLPGTGQSREQGNEQEKKIRAAYEARHPATERANRDN